jgi:hypothetical protein
MSKQRSRIKSLDEATREELLLFVRLALQADVPDDESIDGLRRIVRDCGYDVIEDLASASETQLGEIRRKVEEDRRRRMTGEHGPAGVRTPGFGAPKVRLRIESRGDGVGDERVPVSVNGFRFDIPVGQPVDVPYPYFEALRHAVSMEWIERRDHTGKLYLEPREVQSYPFSVLEMPPREEIEAWRRSLNEHNRSTA